MTRKPARISALHMVMAVLAALHGSGAVHAETSAQFGVSATIASGCWVDGTGTSGNAGAMGALNFGTDSTFSKTTHTANVVATQSIRLRCTPGVSVGIKIDGGGHVGGGVRNLQLGADAASRLSYSLCADAACNQPIAIGGTTTITASTVNANDMKLPIYGRLILPGGSKAGAYKDTLTVTLTW